MRRTRSVLFVRHRSFLGARCGYPSNPPSAGANAAFAVCSEGATTRRTTTPEAAPSRSPHLSFRAPSLIRKAFAPLPSQRNSRKFWNPRPAGAGRRGDAGRGAPPAAQRRGGQAGSAWSPRCCPRFPPASCFPAVSIKATTLGRESFRARVEICLFVGVVRTLR